MIEIEQDTLEQAAGGDIDAFRRIYDSFSAFVYNVALRVTNNSADAEEVTQDVFLKVYRKLEGFQFRSAFKTWLYRITVNTAINYYRRSVRQYQDRVDYDDVAETLPGQSSAAENAIQNEFETRLNGLLKLLSPEYKACLILREIEGLSYEEIASALNIPVNTVRSRLKRARLALAEAGRKGLVQDEVR